MQREEEEEREAEEKVRWWKMRFEEIDEPRLKKKKKKQEAKKQKKRRVFFFSFFILRPPRPSSSLPPPIHEPARLVSSRQEGVEGGFRESTRGRGRSQVDGTTHFEFNLSSVEWASPTLALTSENPWWTLPTLRRICPVRQELGRLKPAPRESRLSPRSLPSEAE